LNEDVNAILSVRYSSSRLPGKALLEISGQPAVLFVANRCLAADFRPFVFTSSEASDDVIVDLAREHSIPFFRGELDNKVQRWVDGFEFFGLEDGHLIDVDDPYFNPESCIRSLETLRAAKELEVLLPSLASDSGEASVGTSATLRGLTIALSRARNLGLSNLDVVPWNELLEPKLLGVFEGNSPNPIPRFRLTLDYLEDYALLKILGQKFGPDSMREDVESFLMENPDLIKINFARNIDFLENKVKFLQGQKNQRK
jgi:spore coat polysaccharide biosynthesis protein SpsF (cytidylyltransferase family)